MGGENYSASHLLDIVIIIVIQLPVNISWYFRPSEPSFPQHNLQL